MILESKSLAPIVLFVYNRPKHTELTLNSLSANELAKESTLYIFSDGPKEEADIKTLSDIALVRKIIWSKLWCKEVNIIESDSNKGLANSIYSGVSEIIDKYGKAIVIEDDLMFSDSFLIFMNKALNHYENHKSVFSISGYSLPGSLLKIPDDYLYDVYVNLRNSSWGWATWKDRWGKVDWELHDYPDVIKDVNIQQAMCRMGDDIAITMHRRQKEQLDVWAVIFTFAHFTNHAVSIAPVISFVNNTGLDGSGINCSISKKYRNIKLNDKKEFVFLNVLYEDKRIINSICNAYTNVKRPVWQKIINRISRALGGKNIFMVKKSVFN